MNKTLSVLFLLLVLSLSACVAQETETPTLAPATETTAPAATTQAPTDVLPTQVEPTPTLAQYTHTAFGFSFAYPSDWFGPDEYSVEQTLRLEIGSDVVYPYGTSREEQIYTLQDSYYIVIQYTKNNQNQVWQDTYQALVNLQDGESISDARSLTTRIRQLDLGRFAGFEYIASLSETAQTEPFYARQVILLDPLTNEMLTIMGRPSNVDISSTPDWRQAYQAVDEANYTIFKQLIESIIIE